MPLDSMLVSAAVIAGRVVLIWADFQTRPPRQRLVVILKGTEAYEAAADVAG